jgi:hypothetical protein
VHEAELGIDQVQVVVQALPFPVGNLELVGDVALVDLEAHARLDRADDTHDPLGDPVGLGDLLRHLLLVPGPAVRLDMLEGDDGASGVDGQPPGVVGDAFGGGLGPGREVRERHPLGPQEDTDRAALLLVQLGEMPLEDHPVVHGQTARDPVPVKILERAHHNLLHERQPPKSVRISGQPPPTLLFGRLSPSCAPRAGFAGPTTDANGTPPRSNPQPSAAPHRAPLE